MESWVTFGDPGVTLRVLEAPLGGLELHFEGVWNPLGVGSTPNGILEPPFSTLIFSNSNTKKVSLNLSKVPFDLVILTKHPQS